MDGVKNCHVGFAPWQFASEATKYNGTIFQVMRVLENEKSQARSIESAITTFVVLGEWHTSEVDTTTAVVAI